ncbi:ArnT family glycosyltransferase [Hymenobacter jejuensis]|uniref:Glycosyltransferase RgtA/B/C/D-like domain-containing protein n=1 Tax=Hymenobacter jejuensis TaxID=2502781 RepID=A0A5B8A3H3_9BACT|nr:glycosyltransferase family 39 protein [Hymenobacter jejuensis]QDA61981.1 hypothetical protein FHG12_18580 [Hymenobacter jejuensis]
MDTTTIFRRCVPRQRVFWVLLVCLFSFFVHLGAPEVSLMESRNFVAAREMAAGGSWLIPTMNGELRLAKPPLPTWAVAALLKVVGPTQNLAVLRLPAALMATLLIFFFWGLARELTREQPAEAAAPGRTAWLSALVLGSSLLLVTTGREGQWDIFSNCFMVGSLWLLVRGLNSAGASYGRFVGAGVLLGCSFLSKGPVALFGLLLPFAACYCIQRLNPAGRARLRVHRGGLLVALLIAVLVGGAWPLYIFEHVQPAALAVAQTEVTAWRERHVQAWWYYLNFPVFAGVWAVVALAALAVPYARRRSEAYIPYVFALGWLLVTLVLLSAVPEKKERYMLPLMPPLALLMGGMLRHWETSRTLPRLRPADGVWLRVWAGLLLLVCLLVPVAMVVIKLPGFEPATLRFGAALGVFGSLAVLVWRQGWQRRQPVHLTGASAAGMAAVLALLMPAYPVWEARKGDGSLRHISDVRERAELQRLPWVGQQEVHIKQVWNAGRSIPTWHPDTTAAELPSLPVVVFSSDPHVLEKLPRKWRARLRSERIDSFFLGRTAKDGWWMVSLLQRKVN